MKEKDAIGGNYKFQHMKVYGSTENFYHNVKSYRRVLDISECAYVYGELSFYNKLFDERDWNCTARLVCTNVGTGETVCDVKKELEVKKDKNTVSVREGWGTPDVGWWKKGNYKWDGYLDDNYLGTAYFYVVDEGMVSPDSNPYFKINSIKLFESDFQGTPINERKYVSVFAKNSVRYVNIELNIDIVSESPNVPLDFKFNFYNDSGQHKAFCEYFKDLKGEKNFTFDTGYGSSSGNYWFEDSYTIEVLFMNELIAVVPFKVAEESIELDDALPFDSGRSQEQLGINQEKTDEKLSFEEATKELNALIGLESVKKQIDEFATYLKFLKIRAEKGFKEGNKFNLHTAFLGNPGTGKTTVAKMLGQIYKSLDLLTKGHVHEVGRVDLVGEYIGQTAPKVKKAIDRARGGILFVDEAYALSDRGDDGKDFGKEVIEVLLKEMSDGKGDLSIIFAGYPKEMQAFLNSNPGMNSRISSLIHFPDYVPDELMQIADYAANKRDVHLEQEAREFLNKKIIEAYRGRDENFGNARYVNGIIEECKQNMALRLMRSGDLDQLANDTLSMVVLEDVEKAFGISAQKNVYIPVDDAALQEALKELHEMIGLKEVKRDVDELAKLVKYYTEIGKDVKNAFSMHTVFTGNPGTGKTTVARILVKIYKALGILERGQLIECDRKDLVAGFTGQTAIKTAALIEKAMGGGLFIDEAYSLTQGGQGDFGSEAVDTLLKRMEDHRGDFIVIAAGYPNEMQRFLEMNPGLLSRFDKTLQFNDYTADELLEIAVFMFDKEGLVMNTQAKAYLKDYITNLLAHKHKYFGYARSIRKVVKAISRKQNLRLAEMNPDERTSEMTKTVIAEDFKDFKLIEQSDLKDEKKGIGFR